jgi:glycosyl-4,4'-diaponeurosporenoate acyltransferase
LRLFARETRRAELAHWWAMCCGPLFVLWNPPLAAVLLVAYGVFVNLPFIVVQRYNRARLQGLLERRAW